MESAQTGSADSGQADDSFPSVRLQPKSPPNLGAPSVRSGACAGEAQSAKSFLALWNRSKLVRQTLGKLATRLQALDRELNVPRTFGHFRTDLAHAQREAQSAKSFLVLWNWAKLVVQTLEKLAIRFQALDRKLNVPRTFGHFRSDQRHV